MIPQSLKILSNGLFGAIEGSDDQDETMNLAITMDELAVVALGQFLVGRLFPEVAEVVNRLGNKMVEVSKAQAFLEWQDVEEWYREQGEDFAEEG